MNKSTMYCFGYLSLQTTYRDFWVFLRPVRWFTGYTSRVPLYIALKQKRNTWVRYSLVYSGSFALWWRISMRVLSFCCLCAQLYGVCSLGAIMLIPHEKLSLRVLHAWGSQVLGEPSCPFLLSLRWLWNYCGLVMMLRCSDDSFLKFLCVAHAWRHKNISSLPWPLLDSPELFQVVGRVCNFLRSSHRSPVCVW